MKKLIIQSDQQDHNHNNSTNKCIYLTLGSPETDFSLKATKVNQNNWYCLTICEDHCPTPGTPKG